MMAEDFSTELQTAQTRRLYWHDRYQAARSSGDVDDAAAALEHLRQYDWLIEWIEARQSTSRAS